MRKVYESHDAPLVGYLASVLESQGIACLVRNAYLGGAVGEIPPTECWPELWVTDERDEAPALRVLADALRPPPPGRDAWQCPACGERSEAQFTECWRCGGSRPD